LLTKLANMLRAEERRPKGERDHELIATINRTIEDLKRQRELTAVMRMKLGLRLESEKTVAGDDIFGAAAG
jgi:hypothetical protein